MTSAGPSADEAPCPLEGLSVVYRRHFFALSASVGGLFASSAFNNQNHLKVNRALSGAHLT
jgi:hypothetical protein